MRVKSHSHAKRKRPATAKTVHKRNGDLDLSPLSLRPRPVIGYSGAEGADESVEESYTIQAEEPDSFATFPRKKRRSSRA